jgi:tetratricopeptide (TPR) repeat protein
MENLETLSFELKTILKSGKTAIFCGAGISFNSGLPIVPNLLAYIFQILELNNTEVELLKNSSLPFEEIMGIILRESTLDEIQEIFLQGQPNSNHILLAKLAKTGYINLICTTNFDLLIEKAFEAEGLIQNRNFKVYSTNQEFKHINWESDEIKLIKIHGSASSKEEMALTMSNVAGLRFLKDREVLVEKIFSNLYFENVIVLGYSCSDLFDISPALENLKHNLSNTYFIDHTPSNEFMKVEPLTEKINKNPFKNFVLGKRIYINSDLFVKSIWNIILNDLYYYTFYDQINWKSNISEWYSKSVKESGEGVKHHIASRLLYAIAAFKEAIEHHTKAIAIAATNSNVLAYSSELGNLGMAYNAIADYPKAKEYLEKALKISKRLNISGNIASQLQALGNVLHHLGENETSIKYHEEALKYAKEHNDEDCICSILGNISNAYNRLGRYEDAFDCLGRGLEISRKLGNKQTESSQLGILSLTVFFKGDLHLSLTYSLESLKIKKMIGDTRGECDAMINLFNIYNALNLKNKAKATCDGCLMLARKIGYEKAEKMALLQKGFV